MPSTQWSTARIPVDRNSHSGVCTVRAGSRITARGITSSWRSISLTLIRALVTPAMALNSPPAIVVGTLIWRTLGAFIGGATPLWTRILSISSTVRTLLARQSCTALAPSVIEPPPTVTIRSAPASRAISAASITACRGVCGGMWSNRPANRLPSARRTLAISSVVRFSVPLTMRKTRSASRRRASSATVSAAGLPNTTVSMAPNATRPDCSMSFSFDRLARDAPRRQHKILKAPGRAASCSFSQLVASPIWRPQKLDTGLFFCSRTVHTTKSPSETYLVPAELDRLGRDVDPIEAGGVFAQDLALDLKGQIDVILLFQIVRQLERH